MKHSTSVPSRPRRRAVLATLLAVGLVAALLVPMAASAQRDPAARQPGSATPDATPNEQATEKIRVLLSGYDYFPTREELLAVSDEAPAILIAIYQDPEAIPTTRLRVIDALGYFDSEEAAAFFTYLLANDAGLPSRELHHAITAYTKAFHDRSVELCGRFLEHADAQIRMTAAVALRAHGGAAALPLLDARLANEPNAVVREKLQNAR